MRKSKVITKQDSAGKYEVEIFDHLNPKFVIVCAHGFGVMRADGESFFYNVANHYLDAAVILVDQHQYTDAGVKMNPLPVSVDRLNQALQTAKKLHPDTSLIILAHSMGCGVVTFVDTNDTSALFFVAPAAGNPQKYLTGRYGDDIINGKMVQGKNGLTKVFTAPYLKSLKGILWEDEYLKLAKRFKPTYVFEAGDEEIVSNARFAHRNIPFTSYEIIKGAKHNFSGQALKELFQKMDVILGY